MLEMYDDPEIRLPVELWEVTGENEPQKPSLKSQNQPLKYYVSSDGMDLLYYISQ